jgi:hypothetical protein
MPRGFVTFVCSVVCVVLTTLARLDASAPDVVLYASDAVNVSGNWSRATDATAASPQTLVSTDHGWSSPNAPLAAPADAFEFTFSAPAGTPYHVWLRLHASANSKFNDSVFVQFSDAVDPHGAALYPIGTTSGLFLNLQSCNGCALSGWGWIDGAYWLTQQTTVSFGQSGTHTLRIQTREDGVQLDEIVLSPSTYLSQSPGQVMNDQTKITKPPTGGSSTPFTGTPLAIPGSIQASDFDNGGEGVAYHDTTSGNAGGAYRQTDVDLEASSDGGNDVGWMAVGEWLNYTVTVAGAGAYTATFRVASPAQGGTFHLEMNGADVTGAIVIPLTGGWQTWQSVTRTVTLAAGTQVARLVIDAAGQGGTIGNITSMRFTPSTPQSLPYGGTPAAVPGVIQAENFDNGGEGVAYHDSSSGNSGGAFRSTDVDVEAASSGGFDVGWVAPGEWLNYSINVSAAGTYTVNFRVASAGQGGTFHLEINGANITGSLTVPNTGGWQNWQTVSQTISLAAGAQMARLVMDSNGSVAVGNFDWFEFVSGAPSGTTITVPAGGDLQSAINNALSGDTILLAPGATYRGTFVLPVKSGSAYITIRSGAADSLLPGNGVRVAPQDAGNLPKVQGGAFGAPAFTTAAGAHHYRLLFLEVVDSYSPGNIIELGDGGPNQTSLAMVPHDLIVDRCYIHGDATAGQKRGIALNSASTTIVNSYISDIKSSESDAQAILIWNGPGPFTIVNNYLEASGENFMIGGADPSIPGLVPADITFRLNHVAKQPGWRGQSWTIKDLIEFKTGQRIVIDSNVLEYSWAAAQQGFAFMITPVNQDGGAPWTVIQHVQVTNNIIRHVASGVEIEGLGTGTSIVTNDIVFRNNLFLDISTANWGGSGRLLMSLGGANIV